MSSASEQPSRPAQSATPPLPTSQLSSSDGAQERISPPAKKARIESFDNLLRRAQSRDYSLDVNNTLDSMEGSNGDTVDIVMDKKPKKRQGKKINDCIHDTIDLPPCVVAIMDTPQFQRLRNLNQTGTCHLVYPNATHNRFQHSIGVAHLARKFAEALHKKYPALMDEKDVLCVMIAGLCHDLGHGPYSHLWEHFMQEATPGTDYTHEDTSIQMLDLLLDENNLRGELKDLSGIDDTDIRFVKELIVGPIDNKTGMTLKGKGEESGKWLYEGRSEDKSFLYEIVANKISGVDVDKWDYFMRDNYYMNIGILFKYNRFIEYARVERALDDGRRRRICLRDKEIEQLKDMCNDRARLHRLGYQHRVALIADRMLMDAWLSADPFITVKGTGGKTFSLSTASHDLKAHELLEDGYVKYKITESEDPRLAEAQRIMKAFNRRDLYETVAHMDIKGHHPVMAKMTTKALLEDLREFIGTKDNGDGLKGEDVTIVRQKITTGMKFDQIYFYTKELELIKCKECPKSVLDNAKDELFVCLKRKGLAVEAKAVVEAWIREKETKAATNGKK